MSLTSARNRSNIEPLSENMAKPKFSNEDLTRWKCEINPAPIISKRTKLTRQNSEWIGLCPFHEEKTGSFTVYKLDDGTWGYKCFGCGANGNVFQFVQKHDKIPFGAAVERVLSEAGVDGWQDGTEQVDTSMPEREHRENATFPIADYQQAEQALQKSRAGQKWLTDRGITAGTAHKFHIGFIQDGTAFCGTHHPWASLGWIAFPTLSADGLTITSIKYRSIIKKKDTLADGMKVSGIMRAQDTATLLYNLQTIKADGDVWVAEGEPDTLVLAQAGYTTVGYPMGGYKPTNDECEILSACKRRFLAGDNDAAGVKAMDDLQKKLHGAIYRIVWPNNRKDANDVLTHECGNDPVKFVALVEELKARVTQTETISILRSASDITPKQIQWLWDKRIPLGKITLFAGNPDNGKSLASTGVAAICSTGGTFSGTVVSCPPSDVLMLIGEDDADDTAVPRLMSAQADLKRIHFLESVRPVKMENREVRLDMDIPAIERQLEANPNIRLMIIDPISNYLGDVSMVAEQEVRSILIPLKRMAEKFSIAIVIVMHLNKKADLDAISRVGGAMAFIGVARCSWLFSRNVQEDAPEGEDVTPVERKNDSFSMLRIKNNLVSSSNSGLAYSVAVRPVLIEGVQVNIPYVVWGSLIEGSADDVLTRGGRGGQAERAPARAVGRPNDKMQAAIQWLENALQDGEPHVSKVLMADAKNGAGIAPDTLRGAKAALKVRDFSAGTPKKWYWVMDPMNETGDDTNEPVSQQSLLIEVEGAE